MTQNMCPIKRRTCLYSQGFIRKCSNLKVSLKDMCMYMYLTYYMKTYKIPWGTSTSHNYSMKSSASLMVNTSIFSKNLLCTTTIKILQYNDSILLANLLLAVQGCVSQRKYLELQIIFSLEMTYMYARLRQYLQGLKLKKSLGRLLATN